MVTGLCECLLWIGCWHAPGLQFGLCAAEFAACSAGLRAELSAQRSAVELGCELRLPFDFGLRCEFAVACSNREFELRRFALRCWCELQNCVCAALRVCTTL